MTQTELFNSAELGLAPIPKPQTAAEAIATGYARPEGDNPFLFSSTLWEAFNIGQYLQQRGISPVGFRKSRGSSYANAEGLVIRFYYDRAGWGLCTER